MNNKIFDGSTSKLNEINNIQKQKIDKYINTKNNINNNLLFYFILIIVLFLTSYCGYNIINIFTTCKENFIIKYIKLFIVISFIFSTVFIIPTYNNTDISNNITESSDKEINKRNNIIEKITRIIKYTVFPLIVSIIIIIISYNQISPHKLIGIVSNILVIAPIIIGAIVNLILIILSKFEPNNYYYIIYYSILIIFFLVISKNIEVLRKFNNYELFSLKNWGFVLLFSAIVFKYINNFIILINNSLNVKDYKNNTKLNLHNINTDSKIKSLFNNIVVGDIIYYIIKTVSDIINIIAFSFFGKYISKQNIFENFEINGYNDSTNIKDNIICGLSTKLLFTNYSTSNLDLFSILLSYVIIIIKFNTIGKNGFLYNLLHVGKKNNLEDCRTVDTKKNNLQKNQKTEIELTEIKQNGGGNKNIIWALMFSFFLSFDTYINDNILKLIYILMKLISLIILNFN